MPEIISCPDCDRKLRVPDNLLGKKVKCPGCSVMFTAVAGGAPSKVTQPAPPPEEPIEDPVEERRDAVVRRDDYDDRPRRRDDYDDDRRVRRDDDDRRPRRRDDDYDDDYDRAPSPRDVKDGWKKVVSGINLNIIGTWIWIGGSVFLALGLLVGGLMLGSAVFSALGGGGSPAAGRAAANTAVGAGVILLITMGIYGLCTLAELVLRVTGYGMCMGVPALRGSNFKALAITAFSLSAAEAVFTLFGCTWAFVGPAAAGLGGAVTPLGGNVISWIAHLLGLAALIVFLLFGRSVALQVRDRGLPGVLITVLIVFCAYTLLQWLGSLALVLGWFGTWFGAFESSSVTAAANKVGTFGVVVMVLGGLFYLAYIGISIWYIFVLQRLRDGVHRHIRKLSQD